VFELWELRTIVFGHVDRELAGELDGLRER